MGKAGAVSASSPAVVVFIRGTFLAAVPLTAILSSVRIDIAGHNNSGWMWCLVLLLAAMVIVSERQRAAFPVALWCPWATVLLARCIWSDAVAAQRTIQMLVPLVVGFAASMIPMVEDRALRVMRWWAGLTAVMMGVLLVTVRAGRIAESSFVGAGAAMTVCLAACCFAVPLSRGNLGSVAAWIACAATCGLSSLRTATGTALLVLPLSIEKQTSAGRVISWWIPGFCMMVLFVMTQGFGGKVQSDYSRVSWSPDDYVVSLSGRDRLWSAVWEHAKRRTILGHGGGSIVSFMWSEIPYGHAGHPHNEFLRVFHDYGAVGVLCLAVPLLLTLRTSAKRVRSHVGREGARIWAVVWRGMVALIILSTTDNPLSYASFFMNPLFCILGLAYSTRPITNRSGYSPHLGNWQKGTRVHASSR